MPNSANDYPQPAHRRLQVFSLDPSVDVQLDNALISRSVLKVPWEDLGAGPVGEYIEVVDVDPSSACAYDPVDLEELLATDGLSPSTGNPQFHQQMAYAVAMLTIRNFERVIGRDVIWAERRYQENGGFVSKWEDRYVQRLRIYPHALRQQNAYCSPNKKALLFGYFNSPSTDPRDELPGGLVFTCLSHDIIAHETTHAILDGIHRRLLEATNADMLAFHEAFADIVAIFQHFTLPDLLLSQIRKTRGRLERDSLLVQLATQFGRATGRGGALRNALAIDEEGRRIPPDPSRFGATVEPHERGAIVVAAVFDAFLSIYENRVADLVRIATGGTGILPDGDIHPDLVNRFAQEAVKAADRVLTICIRAIDYLPPVDITLGDYLRALITADADLVPDDPRRYRLAFIEAFRDRGIYPLDVRTLSEESLRWTPVPEGDLDHLRQLLPSASTLRTMAYAYEARQPLVQQIIGDPKSRILRYLRQGRFEQAEKLFLDAMWSGPSDQPQDADATVREPGRRHRYYLSRVFAAYLHGYITQRAIAADGPIHKAGQDYLGLDIHALQQGKSKLEVHAVRPTLRTRPDGRSKTELLVVLTQRRTEAVVEGNARTPDTKDLAFKYRGGCTLIIDPEDGKIEYSISKNLMSKQRLQRQRAFFQGAVHDEEETAIRRFGLHDDVLAERERLEPLAGLHSEQELRGGY